VQRCRRVITGSSLAVDGGSYGGLF
jgi:hypothetical protein